MRDRIWSVLSLPSYLNNDCFQLLRLSTPVHLYAGNWPDVWWLFSALESAPVLYACLRDEGQSVYRAMRFGMQPSSDDSVCLTVMLSDFKISNNFEQLDYGRNASSLGDCWGVYLMSVNQYKTRKSSSSVAFIHFLSLWFEVFDAIWEVPEKSYVTLLHLTVCSLQTEGSDVKQGDSQQNRINDSAFATLQLFFLLLACSPARWPCPKLFLKSC